PLQAAELAAGAGEILRIAAERGGVGEEEARVEAARAPRRRDRPEDEAQTRPVRPDPRLQHRAQRLRRARSKRRRPRIGPAEREARFLPEFTDRGEREGAAPPGRSLDREQALGLRRERQFLAKRMVLGVDRAARKDEFRRHEGRAGSALAHQHTWPSAVLTNENDGRRITDRLG